MKAVTPGNVGEQCEVERRFLIKRGNAHQAGDIESGRSRSPDQPIGIPGKAPGLLLLLTRVDLDEAARSAPRSLHRLRENADEPRTVDALDDIEERHRLDRLVGLQCTDQMEFNAVMLFPQCRPLRGGFLHTVLAENAMACLDGQTDAFHTMGFCHRNQCHRVGTAACPGGGGRDVRPDRRQIVLNVGRRHAVTLSTAPAVLNRILTNCNNTVFSSAMSHQVTETCRIRAPGATEEGEKIMPSTRLTHRRVDTLKPRKQTHDVRDPGFKGFGVPVMPSGSKRYFLHSQFDGKRIWHTIGDAGAITLESALLAARQNGNADNPDSCDSIPFETVADEVFGRFGGHWKPRALAVNLGYCRNQILPWFKGKPISEITRLDVRRWFASLHATPVAADRSAPILSVIFKQSEAYGYRPEGSNPCTGIKRFLSAEEMRRLSKILDRHQDCHPMETSIVRLLLLTGCRKSEILTLQWSEYRECRLCLSDSKTGPRTVWLSSATRKVLNDLSRIDPWMFPLPRDNGHLSTTKLDRFWWKIRVEAGINDVRCHDLRRSFASWAEMRGVPLPTAARLLGHRQVSMTLRYAHAADKEVEAVAERIGAVITRIREARDI